MNKINFDLQRFDISGTNNTFLTPVQVAREALMILKNNTIMGQLVNRDFENEFAEAGDTVMVRRPAHFKADMFDPKTGIKVQDVNEGRVPVILDTITDVSFPISSKELTLDIQDFSTQLIAPAVTAIEQDVDERLCQCYKDVPYYVGTPGNTPNSVSNITAIRREMNDNKVPMDGRVCVLDAAADAKLLELSAFNNAGSTGETNAIINAQLGRKFGFDFYMDQNICQHNNGTLSKSATMKIAAEVKANVNTAVFTDATLVGNFNKGTIFKFAGDDRPYVVMKDAEATSNTVTVSFYPAARQTFAANTGVEVIDSHTASLAFHRNAFSLVTRPLSKPMGISSEQYAIINDNGLSIRVVFSYDINKKQDICSIDMLSGVQTMIPELACRVLG
jgi:hypothetical protein